MYIEKCTYIVYPLKCFAENNSNKTNQSINQIIDIQLNSFVTILIMSS